MTLSASYSGATASPKEVGFLWGKTNNPTTEAYVGIGSGTSGSFTKALSSLDAGTTYYYKAYILTSSNEYVYGDVKSFTTSNATVGAGDAAVYAQSWLGGYEVPATSVSLSSSDQQYSGKYCHSTVAEASGSTKACIYNTADSKQRVVTHTFSYNGSVLPTYTMLYDQDKHCALWSAFVMSNTDFPDKNVGRNDSWKADPAIPLSWQPALSGSYDGNYSRGHQVASSDRQTTTDQNKQTFYYSNMTPQNQTFNGGVWGTLENSVQALAVRTTGTDRLYVVTGPVFESGYKTTTDGTGLVCPIPTKYFKCIMKCSFNADGSMKTAQGAGYLFEHAAGATRQTVTIDAVEKLTGFDFFANVPAALQNAAESTITNLF
ncbi:MAG: DNA/RNA non-specific endonuclease [Bacteroidales bacterium]|nr:DNA/RNA non-specific endonuclease [Bacteroidales bacterium]